MHGVNENREFIVFDDAFTDFKPLGKTFGSGGQGEPRRLGADAEGVIGVWDGALRIRPLARPAWGRAAIAYGPFTRADGLSLMVHVLNGDNGSFRHHLKSYLRRVARWAIGSETDPLWRRALRFPVRLRRESLLRRMVCWYHAYAARNAGNLEIENLAVGWFPEPAPKDPSCGSDAFLVRGASNRNGELTAAINGSPTRVIPWLVNTPFYYVIVLNQRGATYYIASHEAVPGAAGYPQMRPIAVGLDQDPASKVYAGVQNRFVGEDGFTTETLIYRMKVAQVGSLVSWFTSAHAADRLVGEGALHESPSEVGGIWRTLCGSVRRSGRGAVAGAPTSVSVLDPGEPSGLIHAILDAPRKTGSAGIVWRAADDRNLVRLTCDGALCRLSVLVDGSATLEREAPVPPAGSLGFRTLQVLDDGTEIRVLLDSIEVFDGPITARDLASERGVGLCFEEALADEEPSAPPAIRHFEAHARSVPIPQCLRCEAPWSASGTRAVVQERFVGSGQDLEGHRSAGGAEWRKVMGEDRFVLDETGLRIDAAADRPVAKRTAYVIDWPDQAMADLTAEILPPGTARGEGHKARAGLIFMQDEHNYFIVNSWLDDSYNGSSVSTFFNFRGFEDIYDAVWTNTADRFVFGRPSRFRVVCDGHRFRAYLDDQLVLYRGFRDIYPRFDSLVVNRVGLVANWEWGHDTGSRFLSFVAFTG